MQTSKKNRQASKNLAAGSCLGALFLLNWSCACAAQEGSLIEAALDSSPAQTESKASPPASKSSQAKAQPQDPKALPKSTDFDTNFGPEPDIESSPIHSELPANVPRLPLLGIPLGDAKIGKGHKVETVFRGNPALPELPTVTRGTPSWAIPKKKLSAVPALPAATPAGAHLTPVDKSGSPQAQSKSFTLNVRFRTIMPQKPVDSIWAYPYPPKPPKEVVADPLPTNEPVLKQIILATGYSARPNLERPYPVGGWRWIHAYQNALKKSGTSVPHTMLTMYPWVNKMFPYVLAECQELNNVEEARSKRYLQVRDNYEAVHADLEAQATAKGLVPVELKANFRGVAQAELPLGNWWIAATRKTPTLKFYWQVPISAVSGQQDLNVQLNEANALLVAGGW